MSSRGIVGYTIERGEFRRWAAGRGARPARRAGGDGAPVGFVVGGPGEEGLEPVGWDPFFALLEEHELALVYRVEEPDGARGSAYALVPR